MSTTEYATFGAGCFWGVEAAYRKVPGVIGATAGYMGGDFDGPTYRDVVRGDTGHAEVVQVEFDPTVVSYDQLLKLFWFIHNPTQRDRQGNDVGTQYRSVLFTHSDEQKTVAEQSRRSLEESRTYTSPIVTAIEPATAFYSAEDYHQQYLNKNPGGYCHVNLSRVDDFLASESFNEAEN